MIRFKITLRCWLIAVAVVAVVLTVRNELTRARQQRVDAEIRQLTQTLRVYRLPKGICCTGRVCICRLILSDNESIELSKE